MRSTSAWAISPSLNRIKAVVAEQSIVVQTFRNNVGDMLSNLTTHNNIETFKDPSRSPGTMAH